MTRKHVSLKTKLASALLTLKVADEDGNLVPLVDHDDAKKMTEDQILSLVHWDHWPVAVTQGGPDTHWNLRPLPILAHREKTAKHDAKVNSKAKRIEKTGKFVVLKNTDDFFQSVAPGRPQTKWPKRRMQSRNNLKRKSP